MSYDNERRYQDERAYRWESARNGEDAAASTITDIMNKILDSSGNPLNYCRFDKIIHLKYPPEQYDWAKGTPDYAVYDSSNPRNFILLEIKLKARVFRKTAEGGRTSRGSEIIKYGCESYYLDIEPVYKNMREFCHNQGIDKEKFIIAFIPFDDMREARIVSLHGIEKMIRDGWEKRTISGTIMIPICKYGEGYGKRAYLIPKDATHRLLGFPSARIKTALELSPETNAKLNSLIFQ